MSGFPTQYIEQHLKSKAEPKPARQGAPAPPFDVESATDEELFAKGGDLGVDFAQITSRPEAEEAVRQAIARAAAGK